MSDAQITASLWTSLPLALGLAMDATVVAASIGASLPAVTRRHAFRLSWHFGLFQFIMPILGWLLGSQTARYIDGWDHWVAFALLAAVGGHMIFEAVKTRQKPDDLRQTQPAAKDPTRGWSLIVLSVGTSLDALAVGLALPLLHANLWSVVTVIGLVTSLLVLVGMFAGRIAGTIFGRAGEIAGGLVLVAMGVKILLQGIAAA